MANIDGPRFVWVRNRSANGRGSDPMPQIIHEHVGIAHLEIVAEHALPSGFVTFADLVARYPAPAVE